MKRKDLGFLSLLWVSLVACSASQSSVAPTQRDAATTFEPDAATADGAPATPDAGVTNDASLTDAGNTGDAADGAPGTPSTPSTLGARLLEPSSELERYTHEPVLLRGECSGDLASVARPRFELRRQGETTVDTLEGNALEHAFEAVGRYDLIFVCVAPDGRRESSEVRSLKLLHMPDFVYFSEGAMYATRLDQLGKARRIGPEDQSYRSHFRRLQYSPAGDRILVTGSVSTSNVNIYVVPSCRDESCKGSSPAYQPLIAPACPSSYPVGDWAPDGRSVFMRRSCDDSTKAYLVDVTGSSPRARWLETYISDAQFVAGGAGLFFMNRKGEATLLDTRRSDVAPITVASRRPEIVSDGIIGLLDNGIFSLHDTQALLAGDSKPQTQIEVGDIDPASLRMSASHILFTAGTSTFAVRRDGTGRTTICDSGCNAQLCGNRVVTRASALRALELGKTSADPPIVRNVTVEGAPNMFASVSFASECSLYLYNTLGKRPGRGYADALRSVVADLNTGEWVSAPDASLSASGRYLLSESRGGAPQFSVSRVSRAPLSLTLVKESPGSARFWPLGDGLSVSRERDGAFELVRLDVDTLREVVLASGVGSDTLIEVSSDGERVALAPNAGINLATGALLPNRLREVRTSDRAQLWEASASPVRLGGIGRAVPGKLLPTVFLPVPGQHAVVYSADVTPAGEQRLYSTDLDTDVTTLLQDGERSRSSVERAAVSSDGKSVAFQTRTGTWVDELRTTEGRGRTLAQLARTPVRQEDYVLTQANLFELSPRGLLMDDSDSRALRWLDARSGVAYTVAPAQDLLRFVMRGSAGSDTAREGMLWEIDDPLPPQKKAYYFTQLRFPEGDAPSIAQRTVVADIPRLTDDKRFVLYGNPPRVHDLVTGTDMLVRSEVGGAVPDDLWKSVIGEANGRAIVGAAQQVQVVDLARGVISQSFPVGEGRWRWGMTSSASHVFFADASTNPGPWLDRLDLSTGEMKRVYDNPAAHVGRLSVVSPRGDWAIIAANQGEGVYLVRLDGRSELRSIQGGSPSSFDRTERYMFEGGHVWSTDNPATPKLISPRSAKSYVTLVE